MNNQFCELVSLAMREDLEPNGDITTNSIFNTEESQKTARLIVQSRSQAGIMSGSQYAKYVFDFLSQSSLSKPNLSKSSEYSPIQIDFQIKDGMPFSQNDQLAVLTGQIQTLLIGERLFLNLLQRAISIASYTQFFVEKIKGTKAKVLDTRKTTPGLRELEKAAVKDGRGYNHRFNLSTGILIKDNHIALAGGIEKALIKAKQNKPYLSQIEVEVDSIEQMKIALDFGVDVILLDNFCIADLEKAVQINKNQANKNQCLLEASGGVNLQSVSEIAKTGVDFISIGSLTQNPPSIDIGLDFIYS